MRDHDRRLRRSLGHKAGRRPGSENLQRRRVVGRRRHSRRSSNRPLCQYADRRPRTNSIDATRWGAAAAVSNPCTCWRTASRPRLRPKRRATRRGSAAIGSPAEFFACFRSSRSSSPPRRRARCARRARDARRALRSMRRAVDRAPTPPRPILALVSVALRVDIITASKSSTAAA